MAYCTTTDVKDLFGQANIEAWADLDNDKDPVKIAGRITRAIAWASNEVDSFLRNGIYVVPLATAEGLTPQEIKETAATLAGVQLYEQRGIQEFEPETGRPVHRLSWAKSNAYKTIRQIQAGQRRLDAVTRVEVYPR